MRRWQKALAIFVAGLALCATGGFLARYQIGAAVVVAAMGPFDPAKAPPAPDYADPASWSALPGVPGPAHRLPEDLVEEPCPARGEVDVFYVQPTGYMDRGNWNATVGGEQEFGIPTSVMLVAQAAPFNGVGNVYAPRYRQASIAAFVQPEIAPQRNDGHQALDLAYSDVARAFDHFIAHFNAGRPFILAGHSQGAGHALRLLADKIDATDLRERLVAAYVVGCGMPFDFFERVFQHLAPCASPTQTGCVIHWDTFMEGLTPPEFGFHRYPEGWESARGKPRFCVNPLTWTVDGERADAALHAGALPGTIVPAEVDPDRCRLGALAPAYTWAECHEGRLWVADLSGTYFHDRFGVYHLHDFNLFWMDIRRNACDRTAAHLARQSE